MLGTKGLYQIVCNAWALVRDQFRIRCRRTCAPDTGLVSRREALYNIHFPQSQEALRQAQYRLKFEEPAGRPNFNIQQRRTARLSKSDGFLFPKVGGVFNTFYHENSPSR